MQIPNLTPQIIHTDSIPHDPDYGGLRILRVQNDPQALKAMQTGAYEFQSPAAGYSNVNGILSRKGFIGKGGQSRVAVTLNISLQTFVDLVKYDPSNPPPQDYNALGMKEMHDRTQSDFKGQKAANKVDFRDYLLEGIRGDRTLFLPTVSGWQSSKVFDKTIFVVLDETNPHGLYGLVYLPKAPIMQADGQTQTAALFSVANSKDAIDAGALDDMIVTLEVELNVDERKAGQSFADRNGRGSKKNKNLVISLDTSSALSELRLQAQSGTVFEDRLATGRNTSTSETATKYIVDLSTMEQMLLNVISQGRIKPEHFKRFHVPYFLPFASDFLQMLRDQFADQWQEHTPASSDPFRRIYVHGWPFALKAIALAYFRSRIDEIGPLAAAIGVPDASRTVDDAFKSEVEKQKATWEQKPVVSVGELRDRLSKIKWERYRKHWIDLTGAKIKDGKVRRMALKSTAGQEMAVGQAQNTAYIINAVADKILSDTWTDLTQTVNA
ncbi:hypothetical protein SAMCCGM7_pB0277 (plasmid) [Sinorhizobium americanum CCGM7]|uniref:hypothetical protein n=1 Tax=Sinorhizobium americanum TaxID=194963 RepID=UPI0004D69362|nr:hypothetical protein [Sinorhizobium americanum]APG86992.1 hypothetical protein SAMCCGM7_pB0277 [Sinorhizobium americanum CCGM7]